MKRARTFTLGFTVLTAVYLYAFPSATIPYLALVLGHVGAGFVLSALLLPVLIRTRSIGWIVTTIGAAIGIVLTFTGAARPLAPVFYAHILLSTLVVVILLR